MAAGRNTLVNRKRTLKTYLNTKRHCSPRVFHRLRLSTGRRARYEFTSKTCAELKAPFEFVMATSFDGSAFSSFSHLLHRVEYMMQLAVGFRACPQVYQHRIMKE